MHRPSLSRWGRSAYDTDAALAEESGRLSAWVDVKGPKQDAEVVVVNSRTRVDDGFVSGLPSLKLLITTTNGYEHIDRGVLERRNVQAVRLPLPRRDAVVDATLELVLAGLRQSHHLYSASRQGVWARGVLPELRVRTLRGARVGVVGVGVIGAAVAETLAALGADVVACDPAGVPNGLRTASLEALFQQCDVVTLHASGGEQNRLMVGESLLGQSRRGLVLVNTARGELVDLDAAYGALDSGRLSFLGADVFPEEPWPALQRDAARAGVVLSPHSAGWHEGLPRAISDGLTRVLKTWLAGETLPFALAPSSGG